MKSIHLRGDFILSEHTVPLLTAWESFYAIIGTAAATLTGLMFVVITLTAFNTPNVVHFCIALLISALLTAPWSGLQTPGLLLGLIGVGGTIYVSIILRRFTHLRNYKPVLEDWAWNVVIPFVCYTALFISAIMFLSNPVLAMFFIGAVSVLFLFVGIHNSWDVVTYITTELPRQDNKGQDS